MSTATYLRSRIDVSPTTIGLAVGDVLAILLFATAGVIHHWGDPIANVDRVVGTATPLLVGWWLAGFVGGLYTRDAITTLRRALSWSLPAWVVAVVVWTLLRSTDLFVGGTPPTLVAVTLVLGGGIVVGWRMLAAAVL